jgi:hypothetical protein
MQFYPASCYFRLDPNIPLITFPSHSLSLCVLLMWYAKLHSSTKHTLVVTAFNVTFYINPTYSGSSAWNVGIYVDLYSRNSQ